MAIDLRALRLALVPILLVLCVAVALWELRGEDAHPGVRDPTMQLRSQESTRAPGGGSTHALSESAATSASACGDHSNGCTRRAA
jgi:hypothetical protein